MHPDDVIHPSGRFWSEPAARGTGEVVQTFITDLTVLFIKSGGRALGRRLGTVGVSGDALTNYLALVTAYQE